MPRLLTHRFRYDRTHSRLRLKNFNLCVMIHHSEDVFMFLLLSLSLGAVSTYLLSRYGSNLPYTVVVFILGILLSIVFNAAPSYNTLQSSIALWDNIDPTLILFIFLPALIFGEAMSLNFHRIKEALLSSVILAGPGSIIGTFLLGSLVKCCLFVTWNWTVCFLVGAVLCATDPVAVVALMKKSGASNKLRYLIILEALLNDGSALVLYNLFFPLIVKNSSPLVATEVVIYAVRVVVISPLLGIGIGILSLMLITIANKRMQEDDIIVQVASTLCCAYFSFFIAEYSCDVSGILSCCSAGILLAIFAPTRILSHETMHNVWNIIEWIGNTVLFMLAGLLYGDKSFRYTQALDLARLVILYLLVFVVRFLMITFFYPVLSRIGIRCSWNESLFMTFGGLRGAVSIALALSLLQSVESGETILSPTDGRRIFFLCGGVSALTLIINAVTSSKALKCLGLVSDEIAIDWKVMLHYIKKRLRKRALCTLAKLQKSNPELFDESMVRGYCSILSFQSTLDLPIDWSLNLMDTVKESDLFAERKIEDAEDSGCMRPDPVIASYDSDHSDLFSDVSLIEDAGAREDDDYITLELSCSLLRPINEQILGSIRRVFLDVVRVSYWKQIKLGKLPRQSIAARILLSSIDFGLETIHTPGLQDWENIVDDYPILFPKGESTSIFSGQNWNLHSDWNYPAKLFFSWQEKQLSCVLTSFLEAHAHARRQIPHYLGETEGIDTPEELLVVQESKQLTKEALVKLSKIPSIAMIALRSKQYAAFILHEQEDVIVEFQAEGILTEKYAKLLLAEVHQDYLHMQHDEWWPLCLQVIYRRLCGPAASRSQQS